MSGIRFPGESDEYRAARNELLEAEIALRKLVETVAALRRRLPPGGAVEDYTFEQMTEDDEVGVVHLSEPGQPSLFIYSYMYGPDWEAPCPLCTSFLDGLDRYAVHIEQRLPVVAVAKAPPEMLRSVSRARGWANLRLLSAANGSYSVDYHAESPDGSQHPIANGFTRGPDGIRHFWSSELLYAPTEGHPRHVDLLWPIWHFFDLTPEGRGTDWLPSLHYDK